MFYDITQLKFSSGHEIVCDVLDWPEETDKNIIVRNAMSIVVGETHDGDSIYMFRPWAHYLEKPDEFICVNMDHIIAINRPSKPLLIEYKLAVKKMHDHSFARDKLYEEDEKQSIERFANALHKAIHGYDSASTSNVVQFPRKDDTLH